MIESRSVPPKSILPHVHYRDLDRALSWLGEAFGFREHYRYGNPVSGAQMFSGEAWIMVRRAADGEQTPAQLGYGTQSLTVFVDDVEAQHERAVVGGATIVETPNETIYGEFQFAAKDFEGHHWLFARHACDRAPEEWGAVVANRASRLGQLERPRVCYLEIPATEPRTSAAFYEKLFGWNIRQADGPNPSFDDAGGNVSGTFVDADPNRTSTLTPHIYVANFESYITKLGELGATLMAGPTAHSDGRARRATFRDPGGNLIGLYEGR